MATSYIWYETEDGVYVGELVEEFGDQFLVKVLRGPNGQVDGNVYALVTREESRASYDTTA